MAKNVWAGAGNSPGEYVCAKCKNFVVLAGAPGSKGFLPNCKNCGSPKFEQKKVY